MKKILLVKITSMGDLIQTLPALTDAAKAIPGLRFDWLAEESFKDIPRLHPAVEKIISFPYRRWKKKISEAIRSGEVSQFLRQLRSQRYDMVIDAQSNLKSAFASLLAKGIKYGLDGKSVREYGAQWAYSKKIYINRDQNHAERLRQMMANYLGYNKKFDSIDYGILKGDLPRIDFALPENFIFIIPNASCNSKLWVESYWQELIQSLESSNYSILISWWGDKEKDFALRLQSKHPRLHLLPSMNLAQKATVLSHATAAISVDTGLAHMAAALEIPNVCLYGPSNPNHCGTYGRKQVHLSADKLDKIKPKQVLEAFYELISI